MNISGIRPVDGFYNYSSYGVNSASSVNNVKNTDVNVDAAKEQQVESKPAVTQEEIDKARAKQTFGAYDFASQYDPNATYSLKGKDSELKNLDVEKAISDMQRDEAIHQYQYFVGDRESNPVSGGMEDFSL